MDKNEDFLVNGDIDLCLRGNPASCMSACYFGLDIRNFIARLSRRNFRAAYRLYRNAVAFPGIVSALCDAPCRDACVRKERGGALDLRRLERAAIAYAPDRRADELNLPQKDKTVAVIGAGAGGLACALRLASHRYSVTVYERDMEIGGTLRDVLPAKFLKEEFDDAFLYAPYTLKAGREIASMDEIESDAVYIATGEGGERFGFCAMNDDAMATGPLGIFLGGRPCTDSHAAAIAGGLRAAAEIETYLIAGASAAVPAGRESVPVRVPTDIVPAVVPANGEDYLAEEAIRESGRCLRCDCNVCYDSCDLMQYRKLDPEKIKNHVLATLYPNDLDPYNFARMAVSCTFCGKCAKSCPIGIDLGNFLLNTRAAFSAAGKLPPAFHSFWLEDMNHACGEGARLLYPESKHCEYVFFPGCQLGASDPGYVTAELCRLA